MEEAFTYEEVVKRMEQARRFGSLPGVEVTRRMLAELGLAEFGIPFVHVAGTNGKGSVCAFLTSIMRKAGSRVGTFTSPHLVDFRERIQVNGEMIDRETVTRLGNLLLHRDFSVSPTMFDYCLVLAVLYFREQGCSLAIMETGLGGRLDSTNALGMPLATVITRIGFDHTEVLGTTLEAIAGEKAGIIKAGTYLVCQRQEPEAARVLQAAARRAGVAEYRVVSGEDVEQVSRMQLAMEGAYQWENGAAAMRTARALFEMADRFGLPRFSPEGEAFREQLIQKGLEEARWPGRMEILSDAPFLLVDGAHNGHGVRALADSLQRMYPGEKFHFLMGVMADKDYECMIETILPLALDFTAVTADSGRAVQAAQLAACISRKGIRAMPCPDIKTALCQRPKEGKTIAFGSLYFIGEIRGLMKLQTE